MLRAINMVFGSLRGLRAGLVASVNDELLIEADERDADKARAILEEAMIEAFEITFSAHQPPALSAPESA
jgi:hypothetical protein